MPWSFKTKLLDSPISSLPVPFLGRRQPVHKLFPPLPQISAPLQGQRHAPLLGKKLCLLFSSKTYQENTQHGDGNCYVNLHLISETILFERLIWSIMLGSHKVCNRHSSNILLLKQPTSWRSDHKHSEHISSTFKLQQKPGMSLSCQSIRSDVYLSLSGNCSHSW